MARTYSIACEDCCEQIDVAQGSSGEVRIISGPEQLEALGAFLKQHIGHCLIFDDDEVLSSNDFKDVSPP